jgi:hypothetical protein
MNSQFVYTMASGQVGDEVKFYFHCQLADKSGYAMSEIIFKQGLQQCMGTVKTTRGDLNDPFIFKFEQLLSDFIA